MLHISIARQFPAFVSLFFLGVAAQAATFEPPKVLDSALMVRLDYVGQGVASDPRNNIAAPVTIQNHTYVIDQRNANITARAPDGSLRTVVTATALPAGITPRSFVGVLNIAGTETKAYVSYYSTTLPSGLDTPATLPAGADYAVDPPHYEVIVTYDRAADGTLSNPTPLTAFDATTAGHRGGGMLVLPDGQLLYARGDQLSPDFDGLSAPQDPASTVSKLLLIDTDTGASTIAAQGLRNVQRLTFTDETQSEIAFADIGWQVAEEINTLPLADLLDTTEVENFGWGRNADGNAREGTFYVNTGPEAVAAAIAQAPTDEAGFVQPFAQFGREGHDGFFAVSGPVASSVSFNAIGLLFGDLASGALFATLEGAQGSNNDVFRVAVQAPDGSASTYAALFGDARDEPRFFNFADDSAGVLFERSGGLFRITEVSAAVPIGASGWYLIGAVMLGGIAVQMRRSRRPRITLG